jgi:hypothetical protein
MIKFIDVDADPEDRHHLLQAICNIAYGQRDTPAMRKILTQCAQIYIDEVEQLMPAVKQMQDSPFPNIAIFKQIAISLEEEDRLDQALSICDMAQTLDLDDGTKTGYAGRVSRLERKKLRNKQ